MGRSLYSGAWGGGEQRVSREVITSLDTAQNLDAVHVDQQDPQGSIEEMRASGVLQRVLRYSGSESLLGPLRVGDLNPAAAGYALDLVGSAHLSGDLLIDGATSITGSTRSVTNTAATTLQAGELVYVVSGGANRVDRARANAQASARLHGAVRTAIAASASGTIVYAGAPSVLFELGLVLTPGDPVYVSSGVAGRATNVRPPATAGLWLAEIGTVVDATGYIGGADANSLAVVFLDVRVPLAL